MFDKKSNEALVRAQGRAMDAEWRFLGVVPVAIMQPELGGHGEIDLVCGNGEFTADGAPDLDIDLRPVEGGFVWHFHEIDAALNQNIPHHVLGLFPKLRLIHKFLAQLFRVMRGEAHLVFLQSENLEVFDIHLVDGAEFCSELLLRAINVGIVHVQRTHAHETEKLAALFIAVAASVFRQAQRQVAVAPGLRRENAVVVRAIHCLEIVFLGFTQCLQATVQGFPFLIRF